MYDEKRVSFTNGKIQKFADKLNYVEIDLKYSLEDFDSFNQVRMLFKPEETTYLKCLFFHKEDEASIQVLVGLKGKDEASQRMVIEGTDEPDK